MKALLAVMLAIVLAATAFAASSPPARTGQCVWVHGRFAVHNGSSIQRIWIIGTKRIIALSDYDNAVPPEIRAYERVASEKENWGHALYGDFQVCALEPSRPGRMQHVRMLRTRNLIFRGKPFRGR